MTKRLFLINIKIWIELFIRPLSSALRQQFLLKEFVSREVKGRFAGSMAGGLWTVIHPLAMICSYYFVFSVVLRVSVTAQETGTDHFVVFFLTGFFPWIMFADSLGKSVGVIVQNAGLVTKVVFPVELLPLSTVIASFVLQGIGFFIFMIYLMFCGYFDPIWLLLPFLFVLEALFALGLSYFLAALCVFVRDTTEVLNIFMMIWFFGTPVIYPGSMVPDNFQFFLLLNPMFHFIKMIRGVVLMHSLDYWSVLAMTAISLGTYLLGVCFFLRTRHGFGDVL